MAPIAESTASSLPRWDLSRFGFATPHSEDIDSHLDETAKLAEAFKVRTHHFGDIISRNINHSVVGL